MREKDFSSAGRVLTSMMSQGPLMIDGCGDLNSPDQF